MSGALVIAAAIVLIALAFGQGTWPLAVLFASVWIASPAIALRISKAPQLAGYLPVTEDTAQFLRLTARRTWRYFETFVTPADNHLPPDNFQETPAPIVAHRTSPTNLGLYLLSVASAHDFGWIGTSRGSRSARSHTGNDEKP